MTYRTFIREATNWEEFAHAEKAEIDTGLTYGEAHANCQEFNNNRDADEVASGTKMEFESE
jgi:hypothetical protein